MKKAFIFFVVSLAFLSLASFARAHDPHAPIQLRYSSSGTAPVIHSMTPSARVTNKSFTATIKGSNFPDNAGDTAVELSLGSGLVNGTGLTVTGTTQITCTFDLTGAAYGYWDLKVSNTKPTPDDYGTYTGALKVNSPPTITSFTPTQKSQQWIGSLEVTGADFQSGVTAEVEGLSITNNSTAVMISSTTMETQVNIGADTIAGNYKIIVHNPDGGSAESSGLFTILAYTSDDPVISVVKFNGNAWKSGLEVSPTPTLRFHLKSDSGLTFANMDLRLYITFEGSSPDIITLPESVYTASSASPNIEGDVSYTFETSFPQDKTVHVAIMVYDNGGNFTRGNYPVLVKTASVPTDTYLTAMALKYEGIGNMRVQIPLDTDKLSAMGLRGYDAASGTLTEGITIKFFAPDGSGRPLYTRNVNRAVAQRVTLSLGKVTDMGFNIPNGIYFITVENNADGRLIGKGTLVVFYAP